MAVTFVFTSTSSLFADPIKLINSTESGTGSVQIFNSELKEWRYMCGRDMQPNTATVICNDLGFDGLDKGSNQSCDEVTMRYC